MTCNIELRKAVQEKNQKIIEYLAEYQGQDTSIYGVLGTNLALINQGIHTEKECLFEKGIQNITEAVLNFDANQNYINTYSTGLVSLGLIIDHLMKNELLEVDTDFFEIIDTYGYKHGENYIKENNLDFIAGATGIGFFFESRIGKSKLSVPYLRKWIERVHYKICTEGVQLFDLHKSTKTKKVINLGLAHGLISILKLALKLKKQFPANEKVAQIIKSIIALYKSHYSVEDSIYFYPHYLENKKPQKTIDKRNRLAWCYGDLSIAYILFQAGLFLDDTPLKDLSSNILHSTTERKAPQETMIIDAGLCHGASGVAHIYNRVYQHTQKQVYADATAFWMQQTLLFANNENGILGYHIPKNENKQKEVGLLTGVGGISLAFQSLLYASFDWDFCLLLDEI